MMRKMVCLLCVVWVFVWGNRGISEEGAVVQIVNATSVASICLEVEGREDYPDFPQGLYTGEAVVSPGAVRYKIKEKNGEKKEEAQVNYRAGEGQSLVVIGDFVGTFATPEGKLVTSEGNSSESMLRCRVYSHECAEEERVRYRWVNGMVGRDLRVRRRQEEIVICPGECVALLGQEANEVYEANVDGKTMEVRMTQRGETRNALIIFYLKEGTPTFMRVFENRSSDLLSLGDWGQ